MTILFKELTRIMDLTHPEEEAKKKLSKTYMILNGKVAFISEFSIGHNQVVVYDNFTAKSDIVTVETLKTFLPEAGLYQLKNGNLYLLLKIPKRQWLKSFSYTFYKMVCLYEECPQAYEPLNDIYNISKKDIAVSGNGIIYYWGKAIGFIKNSNTITCSNINYHQELTDWSRDAN